MDLGDSKVTHCVVLFCLQRKTNVIHQEHLGKNNYMLALRAVQLYHKWTPNTVEQYLFVKLIFFIFISGDKYYNRDRVL